MNKEIIYEATLINDEKTYTAIEIIKTCHITSSFLDELIAHGIAIESDVEALDSYSFYTFSRVQTAARLAHELELNASGAILALELFDKIKMLENELEILKHHIKI